MPVVTRSQSIKIQEQSIKKQPIQEQPIKKQEQPIQEDEKTVLLRWFTKVIKQNLLDINKNVNEKRTYRAVLNTKHDYSNNESQYRRIHYDLIRRMTEMFYTINMYYPLVESSKTNSLTIVMYNRIIYMYGELYDNVELMPKNYDEYKVMYALLTEFKDAEKMLIQYIPYYQHFNVIQKNIIAKVNEMFNDAKMKLL